jgi:hypothetical protein
MMQQRRRIGPNTEHIIAAIAPPEIDELDELDELDEVNEVDEA